MFSILNDDNSWRALLAFAPVVLQMPPKKQLGDSWPKIIRRNIAAYKAGARFEYTHGSHKRPRSPNSTEEQAGRQTSRKLAEGDVTGAVQALLSQDSFAPVSPDSIRRKRERDSEEPVDIAYPPAPTEAWRGRTSADEIESAIRSFPNSSSSGPDGLRSRHLEDLTSPELG